MFKIKICLCTGVLLLAATISRAQQNPNTITLKQLLNTVSQKAPMLITDSAAIRVRQAQAAEVRNNWLPNLKLNYQADIGTSNNTIGPYFSYGVVPSSSSGIHQTNYTNTALTNLGIAALDWEVYNFGSYGAQNRVAKSDIAVEMNNFANSKYQLQAYTIADYLQLLRLQDLSNIQAENITRNQEILRSVLSLAKSGVRPGVDTSIAQAELSKARLNLIELKDQVQHVQLQLSALSGIPYLQLNTDTTTDDQLITSAMPAAFNTADTANHPLINYYKSLYQNSLERETMVKRQYNPKIMLEGATWGRGGSIDANDQFHSLSSGFGFDRYNYLVGIGIQFNLVDLRRRQLKLNTQRTMSEYALNKLDEQRTLLNSSAQQAQVELSTARDRMTEIPNQLKAARAGYRQKLSLYKSGLTDIIELNAALNILYRAETDYVQAKYDFGSALFQQAITGNQLNTVLNALK